MSLSIVRFGDPKQPREGLRVGTVRRAPRGVKKADYAAKHLYDVWFPNLSPSEELLKAFFPIADDTQWRAFKRKFLVEMKSATAKRDLELRCPRPRISPLAATARTRHIAIAQFCASCCKTWKPTSAHEFSGMGLSAEPHRRQSPQRIAPATRHATCLLTPAY